MSVDHQKLIDDINSALQGVAQEAIAFSTAEELPPLEPATRVTWATRNIMPPGSLYFTKDEGLYVSVWNSVSGARVELAGRFLKADGTLLYLSEFFTPASDRSESNLYRHLGEGFLLNASLHVHDATPLRGQTFATLTLGHGLSAANIETSTLVSDYLSAGSPRGWPGGNQVNSLEGVGAIVEPTMVSTGAGLPWAVTVPTNARWKVWGVVVGMDIVGGVTNRYAFVNWLLPSGQNLTTWCPEGLAPGFNGTVSAGKYGGSLAGVDVQRFINLLDQPSWPAGTTISIGNWNSSGADTLSTAAMMVEEWIDV